MTEHQPVTYEDVAEELHYEAAKLRSSDPSLSDAEAFAEATDSPRVAPLLKAYHAQRDAEPVEEPVQKLHKDNARNEFLSRVEELRKSRPDLSLDQLWGEIQRQDPDLYQRAKG